MATPEYLDHKFFLAHLAPFGQLPEAELERLAREMTVGHYRMGDTVLKAGERPSCLYLVIDGAVWETDNDPALTDPATAMADQRHPLWCVTVSYNADDVFDPKALLDGVSQHSFIATAPTRCFCLPRDSFLQLVRDYPHIARHYDHSAASRQAGRSGGQDLSELSTFTVAKIRDVYLHPPVYVPAEASIHETAVAMKANKTNAITAAVETSGSRINGK